MPKSHRKTQTGPAEPIHRIKADFFRTLGHPTRVRILELLRDGELTVGELQAKLEIDSSGEFGGTEFMDIREFKAELFNRKGMFVRNLADRLFLHALGRELGVTDRPELRSIVRTSAENGDKFRDLVLLCIESDLFLKK